MVNIPPDRDSVGSRVAGIITKVGAASTYLRYVLCILVGQWCMSS